jgi:tripartite-type tricarboxylate transporter receptor subunit TctC
MERTTKYDYVTALDPLAQISSTPVVMAVCSDQSWRNISDLVDYAKENPGKVKFGNAGVGSLPHIVGEIFARNSGIKIEQVPFRGASESTAALLGGHIQVAVASQTTFNEYLKDGSIRILATTANQRLSDSLWKQIPTSTNPYVLPPIMVWCKHSLCGKKALQIKVTYPGSTQDTQTKNVHPEE